jgi:hypothetical protein
LHYPINNIIRYGQLRGIHYPRRKDVLMHYQAVVSAEGIGEVSHRQIDDWLGLGRRSTSSRLL